MVFMYLVTQNFGGMFQKRTAKRKDREVPQWKLDMLAGEEAAAAGASAKTDIDVVSSSRENAAAAEERRHTGNAEDRGEDNGREERSAPNLRPEDDEHAGDKDNGDDDDDDDDENFDASAYELGGNDDQNDEGEEEEKGWVPQPEMTAEEKLLAREQLYGLSSSRKTFFLEDQNQSEEKSAGRERAMDRKRLKQQLGR